MHKQIFAHATQIKDRMDFSTTKQCSQKLCLAFLLVKGKSGTSICFWEVPVQTLHVQHAWSGFLGISKLETQIRTGKNAEISVAP